jgi:hypothetical protein
MWLDMSYAWMQFLYTNAREPTPTELALLRTLVVAVPWTVSVNEYIEFWEYNMCGGL